MIRLMVEKHLWEHMAQLFAKRVRILRNVICNMRANAQQAIDNDDTMACAGGKQIQDEQAAGHAHADIGVEGQVEGE